MDVLVIDIGGSNVKFTVWNKREPQKFPSSKGLTPRKFLEAVLESTRGWKYDAVSIGFPGSVVHGRPAVNPPSLGKGWVGYRFEQYFKKPVKVINDAAMQALGSYVGGRMLFVGLGTGLGSAFILDDVIVPLELGELSFNRKKTLAQVLGKKALAEQGPEQWERIVHQVLPRLARAFGADYIVLGGGNAKKLKKLPRLARRGSNKKAFVGGARLWGLASFDAKPRKHTWVLV